jgi:hypothetical protein
MGAKEDLAVIVRADTSGLASDLSKAAALTKSFAREIDAVFSKVAPADVASKPLKASAKAAAEAKSSYMAAAAGLAGFTAKAAIAGGTFLALEAGLNGVSTLFDQLKQSVVMAAEVEQNTIAFEVMLGSVEKTTAALGELRKFAAETPFSNKEVTSSARQLLAYGVAADQLIPTLKLLGTISAATRSPLKDMVYRYGTLATQGRAYAVDLHQFTNAGVAINPSLAKVMGVTEAELHKLTEDGRIGINEVQAALVDLAKTRYAGLLERQSQSLKGSWEQLTDAFDRAKIKLGQVIVEEVGLKGAAKGLESFAGKIEETLGGPGVRGAVRFLGDLGKAGAQVGYEFGRAGIGAAGIGLEAFGRAFPGIKAAADAFHGLLIDAQNFKIDNKQLAETALQFTRVFILGIAEAADGLEGMGKGIKEDIIDPLGEVIKRMNMIGGFTKAPLTAWNVAIMKQLGIWDESKPAPKPAEGPLPVVGGTDKEILQQWADLNADILKKNRAWEAVPNKVAGNGAAERAAWRESIEARDNFAKRWGGDLRAIGNALDSKIVPARQLPSGEVMRPGAQPNNFNLPKSRKQIAREALDAFEHELLAGLSGGGPSASTAETRKALGGLLGNAMPAFEGMSLGAAMGPLSMLGPALQVAGNRDAVRPFPGTPPHLVELANKLNEQFTGSDLKNKLGDLDKLRDMNLISPDVYGKGRDNAIREVASRLGIGGESHLPGAALVGSAEDARILAQFRAGNQGQTTEELLKQILTVLQLDLGARNVSRAIGDAIGATIKMTP